MSTFLSKTLRVLQTIARKQLTVLLLVTVLAGSGMVPQKAHAIPVNEVGAQLFTSIKTTIESTVSAVADSISAAADTLLVTKDFTLDRIAFWLAKAALKMIAKSTVRWINSGFQGSPAFVSDLEQFLIDSADEIAGEYIYGSELSFLCSPFELDIRLSLMLGYRPSDEAEVQCTLSGVMDNVEDFLAGEFTAGGMAGWVELTTNPNNNFFGAQASAKAALRGRLQDGKEREIAILGWGNGFISSEECLIVGSGEECTITMPGQAISEALTFQLSVGERTLIEADEINEIVGALFSQLGLQALKGAGGLLGLGRSSGGSSFDGTSYLDRINNPQYDTVGTTGTAYHDPMGQAVLDEREYRGFHADIILRADSILERVEEFEEPTQAQGDNDPRVCKVPSYIPARATTLRDEAIVNQASADANLLYLTDLQARFAATDNAVSTTTLAVRQETLNEFLALQSSGMLHSGMTNARYRFTVDEIKDELSELATELEGACARNTTESSGDGGG